MKSYIKNTGIALLLGASMLCSQDFYRIPKKDVAGRAIVESHDISNSKKDLDVIIDMFVDKATVFGSYKNHSNIDDSTYNYKQIKIGGGLLDRSTFDAYSLELASSFAWGENTSKTKMFLEFNRTKFDNKYDHNLNYFAELNFLDVSNGVWKFGYLSAGSFAAKIGRASCRERV